MQYNIVGASFTHHLIEADVLATPRLIDEGTRHPVEAYREAVLTNKITKRQTSLWRVRDDSYDKPNTEYVRVMVEVVR